jgi:hypothetical protein
MTSAVFWAGTHTTTPLAMLLRMIARNGKVFAGAIATASSNCHDNQAASGVRRLMLSIRASGTRSVNVTVSAPSHEDPRCRVSRTLPE